MKLTVKNVVVALVVGGTLAVVGNYHLLAQQRTQTVLLKTDLVGISGYDLQMTRAEVGPGYIGQKLGFTRFLGHYRKVAQALSN